jgi:hypothetical protein
MSAGINSPPRTLGPKGNTGLDCSDIAASIVQAEANLVPTLPDSQWLMGIAVEDPTIGGQKPL